MRAERWITVAVLATLVGCGRSDRGLRELGELGGVYGVPNVDDDDGDGIRDFRDGDVAGENDLAPLDLSGVKQRMRRRDVLELVLSTRDDIRVWAEGERLLGDGDEVVQFERSDVPDEVQVEFRNFVDQGRLAIVHRRSERTMLGLAERSERRAIFDEVTLDLIASPLILNHHLQPAEASYVVTGFAEDPFFDNLDMVADLDASLGNALVDDDLTAYPEAGFYDVWVQDEFETATVTAPGSRIDVVIDSIRDRGLDPFPERVVSAGRPDTAVRTWGNAADYVSSQDSFGNLEISPPVTVRGVNYPFGRIYWGEWEGIGLVPALANVLEEQRVQDPFTVDVSFLLVGHIDEFTTFLPDSTAPKGFRMYVADTNLAYAFLDGLPASTPLHPRYSVDHGYASLDELRGDPVLRALNEDYQRDYIEPAIDVFERELGLTEADIVRVPGIFEEVGGPYSAALIPGTVNMLVHTRADGRAVAFLPDPFFRGASDPQSADPFIAEFEALLPADVEPVWVDNWDMYHVALGEVHCGTNATRTPTANWWEDALDLIKDGDR